jgi:hypothetical protein
MKKGIMKKETLKKLVESMVIDQEKFANFLNRPDYVAGRNEALKEINKKLTLGIAWL